MKLQSFKCININLLIYICLDDKSILKLMNKCSDCTDKGTHKINKITWQKKNIYIYICFFHI